MMFLLAVLPGVARAACPAATDALTAELARAEAAFAGLDLPGFEAARTELHSELGCLSESPPPEVLARAHGIDAIAALVAKDDASARASLLSARAADPGYALPAAVPEGHRLHTMLAEVGSDSGARVPVVPPAGTAAVVDGHVMFDRPLERPAVVLLRDGAGHVPWSSLVAAGATLPDLSPFAVAPVAPVPVAEPPAGRGRVRPALVVATGVAALGSGILLGTAQVAASRFADPSTAYVDLDGLRSRANGLTVAASVGFGATLGLGAATLVAREAP